MSLQIICRRTFLALGVGSVLAGCAASYADVASLPVIGAVHVNGSGNLWLENMPPYLQQKLIQQLGTRYSPGARGGATLTVQLTDISFPTASNAGFGGVDSLNGRITLTSASGSVLKSFPLFSSTASIDAAAEVTGPTHRRYDWLASSYAHWVLSKLA